MQARYDPSLKRANGSGYGRCRPPCEDEAEYVRVAGYPQEHQSGEQRHCPDGVVEECLDAAPQGEE
jgi:hypothetical protein